MRSPTTQLGSDYPSADTASPGVCLRRAWTDILGTRFVRKGSHSLTASLESADGPARMTETLDLASAGTVILDTSTLTPGRYQLNLTIVDADGTTCAQAGQSTEAVNGPLVL